MAVPVSTSDDTAKNAFDFYNTYLSVIYGLLATQGLTSVVNFTSKEDEQAWDVLSILLFAGTFIMVMRVWFSLANIDDVSRRAYGTVARATHTHSRFNLLLLIDTAFATTFAGLLLAMFSAIPSESSFFTMLVWLAGLTLLYDLASGVLFYSFTRETHSADDQELISRYKGKVNKWIKHDVVFGTAVITLYLLSTRLHLEKSVTLASIFVLLTVIQLSAGLFRKSSQRSSVHT